MDDKSAQEDEILAIKSIYEENDLFSFDDETKCGKFFIKIECPESKEFTILFANENSSFKVEHLPPILIEFVLPVDYPSKNAPSFKLFCRWLSLKKISKLCKKLDDLWDQNCNTCVLFTWFSFLSDELFDYLKINLDEIRVSNSASNSNELNSKLGEIFDDRASKQQCSSHLLKNYDKDQKEIKFNNSYFTCNVCFMEKKGVECMKFNKCEHIFCNECMKMYFETQIKGGNVKSLTCPHDKCETQAIPAQVLSLVGIEMFNRYDSLLLKDSLNNMHDIVYCPRASCQCPVIPEETLAQCPDCKYVFCSLCRQGYHGVEPCKITNTQLKEICNLFNNGDEIQRQNLIKQYGEKRIKRAIEEHSSMELIQTTSKQCPNCKSWMQKLDGCNKMACVKCHCYFCWLCLKVLSKTDPYSHFNSANSECFEKLFEGIDMNNRNEENENDDDDWHIDEMNFETDSDQD